jgi:glutamyl-tRNA synthetase
VLIDKEFSFELIKNRIKFLKIFIGTFMLRFAPSPTGDMHVSDLRVALFNYIISKQKNEDFIVRIENNENNIEGKDKEFLDLLSLFGIEYSQVIYQSENVRFHTAMALQLMHEKKAFSCFCSDNWLEKKHQEAKIANKPYKYDDACRNLPDELVLDNTNPFRIRLKKPDKVTTLDSFIIMNQDKIPTNDFACAVDDMLSDISFIVRNEELTSNTTKQIHIRNSLSYDKQIKYIHLANISNTSNITSVKGLLEEGFLPEAISNYLISMGNKPPQEIFNIEDAIKWLDLEKISSSPTLFDINTLKHINREHLKNLENKELSRYVGFADEEIGKLAKVYLKEVSTTKELKSKIELIFSDKNIPEEFRESSKIIIEIIKNAPYFNEYDDFKSYIMQKSEFEEKMLSKELRYLLTGASDGPDISEIYKYLKNYIGEVIK